MITQARCLWVVPSKAQPQPSCLIMYQSFAIEAQATTLHCCIILVLLA